MDRFEHNWFFLFFEEVQAIQFESLANPFSDSSRMLLGRLKFHIIDILQLLGISQNSKLEIFL